MSASLAIITSRFGNRIIEWELATLNERERTADIDTLLAQAGQIKHATNIFAKENATQ